MKTTDELRHDLADRMVARITELGLSQAEAATICGVQQPLISAIKRHRFENVSADRLLRLLERLGLVLSLRVKMESKTRGIPEMKRAG